MAAWKHGWTGIAVDLGHARRQCVLAVLLVEANQAISAEQLIDRVWATNPPSRARNALHGYLGRLRTALADAPGVEIIRAPGGYVLSVDEQAVDLHHFRLLVAQARAADDEHALELYDQAFALWQGEAFAGLEADWLTTVRSGLDAERLAAELDHTDVRLRCGRHAELLPWLSAQAGLRPLDERLAAQLMLTLYHGGRQAEALQHYQATRLRLAGELGTDPSAALQELHQQILRADESLTHPAEVAPRSDLPGDVADFTGRTGELRQLLTAAQGGATVVISAIDGMAGIGKTTLALRAAHQLAGSGLSRMNDTIAAAATGSRNHVLDNHIVAFLSGAKAITLGRLGRLAEAAALAADAVDLARQVDLPETLTMAISAQSLVLGWAGDHHRARRNGLEAARLAEARQDWTSIFARATPGLASLYAADLDTGRGSVQASCDEHEFVVGDETMTLILLEALAHAAAVKGRSDLSGQWAERAERVRHPVHATNAAMADLIRAHALTSGDPARAAVLAHRAAETLGSAGLRLDEGRARLRAGLSLTATGRPEEALTELTAAVKVFNACGARELHAQAVAAQRLSTVDARTSALPELS